MADFDALTWALEDWFDKPLRDLPEAMRQRVEQEFFPMPWDSLSADQRRSVALQLDYQHDPATAQDQQYWWNFFERMDAIKKQISEWTAAPAPTAGELALKETRLAELRQELARMESQQRQARGDYYPEKRGAGGNGTAGSALPGSSARYVAYPKAMYQLAERLGATPEELAAWVWFGPEDGGIAAYLNANELGSPPRLFYSPGSDSQDYVAPLMACWFNADDVASFEPTERYITGTALIERWSQRPGLQPAAFICAKIAESRLNDFHPIYGGTQAGGFGGADYAPLESGLFALSAIKAIEAEDFPVIEINPSSIHAATQDGGMTFAPISSDEFGKNTVRREARKLNTQAMYKSWRNAYRKLLKDRPNMSDSWYALQIAKMDISNDRNADTIRKHMKP